MPTSTLDRRLTPARPDLAAARLVGRVEAARFIEGAPRRIVAPIAPLRRAPSADAMQETQALFGETLVIFEEKDGWAWAQLDRDSYVGYIEAKSLGSPVLATHRIRVPRSFGFPGASIKLPPALALPFDARIAIASHVGDFAVTVDGLHFWARHLTPLGEWESDFVGVAERFVGAPYLWGGRTPEGVDCSGLVQSALAAVGVKAPRDSDQQEATLGAPVAFDASLKGLRRGDLIFWKGHVGIMRDATTLLHANGWHMLTVSEPLREACDRINEKAREPITSVRRLELRGGR